MRSQPPTDAAPPAYTSTTGASCWPPSAGAPRENVVNMHNELIRSESVEQIFLIHLNGRVWLDRRLARLAVLPNRLGGCRRARRGRRVEVQSCAPGEAGLAPPPRNARRIKRRALTLDIRRRRRCLRCWQRLGRSWRRLDRRALVGSAGVAGSGDVERDHAVARERATGRWLLRDDEAKQ